MHCRQNGALTYIAHLLGDRALAFSVAGPGTRLELEFQIFVTPYPVSPSAYEYSVNDNGKSEYATLVRSADNSVAEQPV